METKGRIGNVLKQKGSSKKLQTIKEIDGVLNIEVINLNDQQVSNNLNPSIAQLEFCLANL